MYRLFFLIFLGLCVAQAHAIEICIERKCLWGEPAFYSIWGYTNTSVCRGYELQFGHEKINSTKKPGMPLLRPKRCAKINARDVRSSNPYGLDSFESNVSFFTLIDCYTDSPFTERVETDKSICRDIGAVHYGDTFTAYIDGRKTARLCRYRYDRKLEEAGYFGAGVRDGDNPNSCKDPVFASPRKLIPGIMEGLDAARSRLQGFSSDRDRLEVDYKKRLVELEAILERTQDLSFDEISESDLTLKEILELYNDFQLDLELLEDEVSAVRSQLDNEYLEIGKNIDVILVESGLDESDFVAVPSLNIQEIQVPSIPNTPQLPKENDFYLEYTNQVIDTLSAAYLKGDNRGFMRSYYVWAKNMSQFRKLLEDSLVQSPEEWQAIYAATRNMSVFLQGKVDSEYWFVDSQVTAAQRKAIDTIENHFEYEGRKIREELRTWRGVQTEGRENILKTIEVLGNGMEQAAEEGEAVGENYKSAVVGALNAVKDGVVCLAKAVTLGDFGDLYELVIGKSICTGEDLSVSERAFSALGLAIGNGAFWRGVAKTIGLLPKTRRAIENTLDIYRKAVDIGLSRAELDSLASVAKAFGCK